MPLPAEIALRAPGAWRTRIYPSLSRTAGFDRMVWSSQPGGAE